MSATDAVADVLVAPKPEARKLRRVVFGTSAGTIFEAYDFILFGTLAPLISRQFFSGVNEMRLFQEEIFGPVLGVTTFSSMDEAVKIANDTMFGLGAGVWSRSNNNIYKAGRAIQAGRVWCNAYHVYPAHAAFGGYKKSGIGRENHLMMLSHYQQTKNLLVSYATDPTGLF